MITPSAYSNSAAMAGILEYLRGFAPKQEDLFTKTEAAVAKANADLAERGKKVFGEENFKMSFGTTEAYKDILFGENTPERQRALEEEELAVRQSDEIYSAVVDALTADKTMLSGMQAKVKKVMSEEPLVPKGVATFVALHETIFDNREAFPPEEFVMRVNYWPKGADTKDPNAAVSMMITIPSLKIVNAMKFAERTAEKERVYFEAIAEAQKNAVLDPEVTTLQAMEKALKTLVDNQPVEDLFNQPTADEEALAKPYLENTLASSQALRGKEIIAASVQG